MLLAVVAMGRSALALPSLLFFLAAYALGNLAAFGVVGALRGLADRGAYAGLAVPRPWLAFAMTMALLSLIGVPPLAGVPAKLTLLGAAIDAKYGWLAVVAVINTAISVAYYVRVFVPMYSERPAGDATVVGVSTLGPWAIGGACVAGLGIVVLGIWSGPFVRGLGVATLLPH